MTKAFSKSPKKFTFVTKGDKFLRGDRYNIILSPQFYWVKKAKLPVKSISGAKKLAASIYEGSLPDGNYSYEVRKDGDEFIIIAYDKSAILDELKRIFPAKNSIKDIYFAQDVLNHIKECTAINDKAALSSVDSIIIQVPRACVDTQKSVAQYLDNIEPGRYKIKLSANSNELFNRKNVILFLLVSMLLGTSFLLEYINYKSGIKNLELKKAQIIKDNKLPSTMIQLRSIKKSLSKKFASQKSIRELLYAISKIDLKDGEYFQDITANAKGLDLKVHILDPKRESEIKNKIKKFAKIISSSMDNSELNLRISL